ncbi:MAG: hypothetical protein DMF91_10145, partial [Acidobacteria bacterium]
MTFFVEGTADFGAASALAVESVEHLAGGLVDYGSMNGFNSVTLQPPGLIRRLFGRKSKENALREIQNLLAERSLEGLAAADVETILSNYELPRSDAQPGLIALYESAVDY